MFDKVLIGGGILLGSVLIIENVVSWLYWYLFLSTNSNNWLVIFVSLIIWTAMGYWIKGITLNKNNIDDNWDDYNF